MQSLSGDPGWARLPVAGEPPPPQFGHRALYDPVRDRMLVFRSGNSEVWALTLSGSHEGTIDLLLTDVMMPGLSGAEVCRRVRESRPGIPTLFISGFYPEAVFPDHRLPEAAAFLAKPFMPEELTDAVDDLLAGLAGQEDGRPMARRAARRRL